MEKQVHSGIPRSSIEHEEPPAEHEDAFIKLLHTIKACRVKNYRL